MTVKLSDLNPDVKERLTPGLIEWYDELVDWVRSKHEEWKDMEGAVLLLPKEDMDKLREVHRRLWPSPDIEREDWEPMFEDFFVREVKPVRSFKPLESP